MLTDIGKANVFQLCKLSCVSKHASKCARCNLRFVSFLWNMVCCVACRPPRVALFAFTKRLIIPSPSPTSALESQASKWPQAKTRLLHDRECVLPPSTQSQGKKYSKHTSMQNSSCIS